MGDSNDGSIEPLCAGNVNQFFVSLFGFEGRATKQMTACSLSGSGVSKHSDCRLYDLEEGHISSLYSFEESLSFGLDGDRFGILESHRFILNTWW